MRVYTYRPHLDLTQIPVKVFGSNERTRLMKRYLYFFTIITFLAICFIRQADATPLLAIQAAERCDTCHEMPNRSDPKWMEENYTISERTCRLSCGVCHVNLSGGGLRNDSGFLYGTKALPSKTDISKDIQDGLREIKNNKFLTLGGDFRFLLLSREGSDANPLFFPMQSDIYANANLGKHISLMTQMGLERGGNSAVREAFGMIKTLPYNAYFKAGKFVPPYGHRLDDHTAFIRTKLGLDHSQPGSYVSGYEIGAEPVLLFARFSQFNADVTPAGNTGKTARGVSGEMGWRGLWLHLGASYINIANSETSSTSTTDKSAYGLFGAMRYKSVSYLFEFDTRRNHIEESGGSADYDARITFNELNYKVVKGANIKLRYETYEPDKTVNDSRQTRYMAGLDIYPYPFTEINLQYRINNEEAEKANNDVLLLAHIWF